MSNPNEPNFNLQLIVLNLCVKLKEVGLRNYVGNPQLKEGNKRQFNFTCHKEDLWSTLHNRSDFEIGGKVTEDWNALKKKDAGALHFKRFGDMMQAHIDQVGYFHPGRTMATILLTQRHLWNNSSYKDVFGIRDILLTQGGSPSTHRKVRHWFWKAFIPFRSHGYILSTV